MLGLVDSPGLSDSEQVILDADNVDRLLGMRDRRGWLALQIVLVGDADNCRHYEDGSKIANAAHVCLAKQ